MTVRTSSAQTRDDARVNGEREEAQAMIACGFDVHRAQITFDLVDHQSGELRRGRVVAAGRGWVAGGGGGGRGGGLGGTTGWRFGGGGAGSGRREGGAGRAGRDARLAWPQ